MNFTICNDNEVFPYLIVDNFYDEKEQLLSSLHVTIKELPKIKVTDSAIQDLEASSGDIIKIQRESRSAGQSIYYRVVIE